MANHTQVAEAGEATFTSLTDHTTGIDFPADGSMSFEARGVVQGVMTSSGIQWTPGGVAIGGNALTSANRIAKTVKVALVAASGGGGVLSWQNPEATAVIASIDLDITTQSTGACTVDVGYTATNAATSSDTLLDGLSVATAGVYTSLQAGDQGTDGRAKRKVASGKWITATVASGTVTGLAGFAYITYYPI